MTLIELVAATVLMSLMVAALGGVMASIARQQRSMAVRDHLVDWPTIAVEAVLDDLTAARGFAVDDSGVVIRGFFPPLQRLETVRYSIRQIGRHRVLVRQSSGGTALMGAGVGTFSVVPRGAVGTIADEFDAAEWTATALAVASPLPVAPPSFRVRWTDAEGRVVIDAVVGGVGP